jgi:hypothetical protein
MHIGGLCRSRIGFATKKGNTKTAHFLTYRNPIMQPGQLSPSWRHVRAPFPQLLWIPWLT